MFDRELSQAIQQLRLRAERSEIGVESTDEGTVIARSFVDTGLLLPVDSDNNQVVFGRRGTGKTHLLRYLEERRRNERQCICYIDCRALGSSSQFLDTSRPLADRTLALFRDVMMAVLQSLSEHSSQNHTADRFDSIADRMNDLRQVLTWSMNRAQPTSFEQKQERARHRTSKGKISFTNFLPSAAEIDAESSDNDTEAEVVRGAFDGPDTLIFPDVSDSLRVLLATVRCRLWLLIDEWSSLPVDVQPAFAEFLRRVFVPLTETTFKIAAIEHRSRFRALSPAGPIGLELGADVVVARNLDDYYNIQLNGAQLAERFATIFYNHLFASVGGDALRKHRVHDAASAVLALCGQSGQSISSPWMLNPVGLLVDASGGNPRDFLQMLANTYAADYAVKGRTLTIASAEEAIRTHTLLTKLGEIGPAFQARFRSLIRAALKPPASRNFLVPQEAERHPFFAEIQDARLLHPAGRSIVSREHVGVVFTKLSLDLGIILDYKRVGMAIDEDSASQSTISVPMIRFLRSLEIEVDLD